MPSILNWAGTKCLEVKYQSIKTLHHVDFKACNNMFLHLSIKSAVLRHAELRFDFKISSNREVTVSSGSKGQL